MTHSGQKKIAVINDLSGFGRCSLTIALPVISHLGIQCCPVPTSILSNHTGFPSYFFDDYTRHLPEYIDNWRKLGLTFDGIASGFLGSAAQIGVVRDFIRDFRTDSTVVVVDPVMGDNGKIYVTYDESMCAEMAELVESADILTPNLTECCKLTGTVYRETGWREKELEAMAGRLSSLGPGRIVVTGIAQGQFIANYIYERGKGGSFVRTKEEGARRSGTGDLFASVIAADAVNGVPFARSVRRAAVMVKECMRKSEELHVPEEEGVCFEEVLWKLRRR